MQINNLFGRYCTIIIIKINLTFQYSEYIFTKQKYEYLAFQIANQNVLIGVQIQRHLKIKQRLLFVAAEPPR